MNLELPAYLDKALSRRRCAWVGGIPRWIRAPLVLFGVSRLVVVLTAIIGGALLPDNQAVPLYHLRPTENIFLDVFGSRWDTGFYVSIAEEGYRYESVTLPSVPFFPLLPLLMKAFMILIDDAVIAGVLVSNLALLGASMLVYRFASLDSDEPTARRAVWYFLIFPLSFFGSAIYSESVFILTSVAALYFARLAKWEFAGIFAILASLSRFMGIIIGPVLLIEWWVQHRRTGSGGQAPASALLAVAAAPTGLLLYMAYLGYTFGDPLAFSHGSAAWGRVPTSPLTLLAQLFENSPEGILQAFATGRIHYDNWIDFLFVALFATAGIALLIRRHWSESAFVMLGVVIAFSSGLWMSQRRYMWALFPAFLVMARWGGQEDWIDRLVTAVFLAGLAIFTVMFANGYWVA
jgi:hypothetical protein